MPAVRVRVFLDDEDGPSSMFAVATVPSPPRTEILDDDWAFWSDGKLMKAIIVRRA